MGHLYLEKITYLITMPLKCKYMGKKWDLIIEGVYCTKLQVEKIS